MNFMIERFPTQGIRSEIPYQSLLRLHEEVETGNFSKPDENQETNTINLQLRLESVVLGDVGHLSKEKAGCFAKTSSFFLRASGTNCCLVNITGNKVNLRNGEGL